ncbi:MAG: formate dehydrogenase subunit alpha [Oceanospirillaceae bacterium]|jgi:formate dehydrogenase major subunit|nr:formate dehydrogenase subunit alpha [Oceanospirillaceae bacterium]MBT6100646.1 formate dehydrogenase subunit alpha [Oceanospirillaceae bacterium]MDC0083954.1 formate dehydrogenase subunit alpha [Oceanospirillaceae bacterium]
MSQDIISFTLDGESVTAKKGETIWQVAQRYGETIPHLCYKPEPGYRADGNCRACMVEIEGERVLAASCLRSPSEGMVITSANSERAQSSRKMVMELLATDQPDREESPDKSSHFWAMADLLAVDASQARFDETEKPCADNSSKAMRVNLQSCINCNLCVRACREVQVNDVIGMAHRGAESKIVFDFDDPMGDSTCVNCGECVQACPTGALMPSTVTSEDGKGNSADYDRKVDSVCQYCGVGCQLTYHVKDERIVYVDGRDGPANQNRLCVKGRFGSDYIHHGDRITKPLIRLQGARKGIHNDFDPAKPLTHFREASWEEALDFAANGFVKIRDTQGKKALAGFGSAKGSNEEAYLFQKLVRTGFGSNNVDHCTRLCHASSVMALLEGLGSGAVSASFMQAKHADVVVITGANPTNNHPVAATFFKQAAKNGTKIIVLDPRGLAMKKYASHMIQCQPASDVSFWNAIMNVIVTEELYNQKYIDAMTTGFDAVKAHVKHYTPEAMAPICGIDAGLIREVARLYATANNAMIFWGMGVSQHVHGTDNCRAMISVALMTGQIGREGSGLHPLRGQNNVQGASDAGLIPMMYPDYKGVNVASVKAMFEDLWDTELSDEPGLTVVETMDAVHDGSVTGMYVEGENPAMSDPDLHHARGALAKLQHLVVQDLYVTETAMYADVVLPASAWPEKDGTASNTNRTVQMGRQAVNPPGDARQDWWIIQELANRMGLNWTYTHPKDVFAEMKQAMPSLNNLTWERLEREHSVTYPCPAEDHPGNDIVFIDSFPIEGGRGKFVAADIVDPDERPDDEYPVILTTGRQLEHWHTGSMTRRAPVLDALEPEAVATLSREELSKIGAKAGDMIRVSTRRGSIELLAREDADVPAGVIYIPFCFSEAAVNMLTNAALDPVGKIPEFKFCASRIERVN